MHISEELNCHNIRHVEVFQVISYVCGAPISYIYAQQETNSTHIFIAYSFIMFYFLFYFY